MKTVIEMALEAEIGDSHGHIIKHELPKLERFAELVRADERNSWPAEMEAMERQVNILTDALAQERERTKWDVHSCGPTCKRYACVAMREAVDAEREACAVIAETPISGEQDDITMEAKDRVAAAIRARSKT